MVACEAPLSGRRRAPHVPTTAVPWSAVAAVAAMALVGVAMFTSSGSPAVSPHQTELLSLWDRPYHTVTSPGTTMLWNAASDDAGTDNSDDDSSEAYTQFDTYGQGSASLSSDSGDDSYDSGDNRETELSDSDSDSLSDISMPDTRVHSWDSANSAALKEQLHKMFSKGINKISKQITAKAEHEASSKGFFGHWAKVATKKISQKKFGLNSAQRKLYKEAESSVLKDQAKQAASMKAYKTVVSKEQKAEDSKKHGTKLAKTAAHDLSVKAKLQAADRLSTKLARHGKKASVKHKKTKAAPAGPPKADPGKIGSKSAVKALKQSLESAKSHKAKAAARAKMVALMQQIKNDFASVTSFAHKVKTSLPPMKAKI